MAIRAQVLARTSQVMPPARFRAARRPSRALTSAQRARPRASSARAAAPLILDVDARSTSEIGYYRWPAIKGNEVYFVCEDDVYAARLDGSEGRSATARRLTQAHGACQRPVVSPDGSKVAFSCVEDGYVEIYVVDSDGGPMKQLTHMGASYARACCFSEDGKRVYFTSSGASAEPSGEEFWVVNIEAGAPMRLGIGPGQDLDVRTVNGKELALVGRNTEDPGTAHWRGYAGGAGGEIWIGSVDKLVRIDSFDELTGNFGNARWLNDEHIVFTMEVNGNVNVYHARVEIGENTATLSDVTSVTDETVLPARSLSVDTTLEPKLSWTVGGEIHFKDGNKDAEKLAVKWVGPRTQLSKRFVYAEDWLENWDLHPEGLTVMTIVRGQPFTMGIWDGPVLSYPPATIQKTPKGKVVEPLSRLARKSQARVRLGSYLFDGERLVYVSDASGEDDIELHWEEADRPAKRLGLHHGLLGRVEILVPSPEAPLVAVVNHRESLLIINVENGEMRTADSSSEGGGIDDLTWSPCGNWLAYTHYMNNDRSCIRILDVRNGKVFDATRPVLGDHSPAWDPDGKYLYFLGSRELEPVYDAATFGLAFPHVERPHLIILQKDVRNPLLKELRPPYDTESSSGSDYDSESESMPRNEKKSGAKNKWTSKKKSSSKGEEDEDDWETDDGDEEDDEMRSEDESDDDYAPSDHSDDAPPPIEIDVDGLTDRVIALPMPISRYGSLCGLEDGRFMVVEYPPSRGAPGGVGVDYSSDEDDEGLGSLISYSIRDLRRSILIHGGVSEVSLSMDRKCMAVERDSGGYLELRVYKAGVRPEEEGSDSEELDQQLCDRRTGLVNLDGRIRVLVDPQREWAQMLGEVYRRLRDDFYDEDMNGVDWEQVLEEYEKLLPKVSTRTEFADLLREMTARLGCSHVAVTPGDPGRSARRHSAGYLGADFIWDAKSGGYRIMNIVKGDSWDDARGGVLSKPGVNINEGDILLSIDRIPLTEDIPPASLLIEKGGAEVLLMVKIDSDGGPIEEALDKLVLGKNGKKKSTNKKNDGAPKKGDVVPVRVRAMHSEVDARYRDMIQKRTSRVHTKSDGLVGYLHVPDMERTGYSEFWRHYACEVRKGSLILDLRGNTGGHISELLLSKLSQRALAWDIPRRGELQVYPQNTPGPLVMLVDERTGSDAELMAESFRNLGLGRVVGTRTWGGLLSINGSGDLIDGSELSLPSQNVLLVNELNNPRTNSVENRGVVPDVEVRVSPADHARGADPQLDRAVKEALELLETRDETARAPLFLNKARKDETAAQEIEKSLTRKPWSFATWAPLPPTKEEEEKARAARSGSRAAKFRRGAARVESKEI